MAILIFRGHFKHYILLHYFECLIDFTANFQDLHLTVIMNVIQQWQEGSNHFLILIEYSILTRVCVCVCQRVKLPKILPVRHLKETTKIPRPYQGRRPEFTWQTKNESSHRTWRPRKQTG